MNEGAGIFVGPNDGKVLTNKIGGRMAVKVRDEDSAGAYSIHDNVIPAGSPGPGRTSIATTRRPSTSWKASCTCG
jgi:hypothetical protein